MYVHVVCTHQAMSENSMLTNYKTCQPLQALESIDYPQFHFNDHVGVRCPHILRPTQRPLV